VRMMWCWRCGQEMPMLDEDEFEQVGALMSQGVRAAKEFREEHGIPLKDVNLQDRFKPALDLYEEITGFRETNPKAIWHHRISHHGPDCTSCGRPLRTPDARHCAECGARREGSG